MSRGFSVTTRIVGQRSVNSLAPSISYKQRSGPAFAGLFEAVDAIAWWRWIRNGPEIPTMNYGDHEHGRYLFPSLLAQLFLSTWIWRSSLLTFLPKRGQLALQGLIPSRSDHLKGGIALVFRFFQRRGGVDDKSG